MVTVGSVTREAAARRFGFLAAQYRGRRAEIRAFTHRAPEFVFWITPEGKLRDARDSHLKHPPRSFEYILDDEPDYGGFQFSSATMPSLSAITATCTAL